MGFLRERIREEWIQVITDVWHHYFLTVGPETTPEDFSDAVFEICDRVDLSREDKRVILGDSLSMNARLLSVEAVEKYLSIFPDDRKLVFALFRCFEGLKTSVGDDLEFELPRDSINVRMVRALLRALKMVDVDDRRAFARLALKKFPNMPSKDDGGHPQWVRLHLENIAGYHDGDCDKCRKMKTAKETLPKPIERIVAPPPKTEAVSVVVSPFQKRAVPVNDLVTEPSEADQRLLSNFRQVVNLPSGRRGR